MFVYLCVPWPEEKIGLQASGGLRAGARDSAFSGAGGQVVATVRNAKAHGHSTLVPCTSLHSPLNALFGTKLFCTVYLLHCVLMHCCIAQPRGLFKVDS